MSDDRIGRLQGGFCNIILPAADRSGSKLFLINNSGFRKKVLENHFNGHTWNKLYY